MQKIIRLHLDTEFTDFINMDLISIGVAADNGAEFYGENLDYIKPWASQFVKENICPLLNPEKYGMYNLELSARLWSWIEELPCDGVVVSYDYQGDWELLNKLFQEDMHPKVIAMENIFDNIYYSCDEIVKGYGGDNNSYDNLKIKVRANFDLAFGDYFRRTKEIPHHALSDAKANREAYTFIVNQFGIKR